MDNKKALVKMLLACIWLFILAIWPFTTQAECRDLFQKKEASEQLQNTNIVQEQSNTSGLQHISMYLSKFAQKLEEMRPKQPPVQLSLLNNEGQFFLPEEQPTTVERSDTEVDLKIAANKQISTASPAKTSSQNTKKQKSKKLSKTEKEYKITVQLYQAIEKRDFNSIIFLSDKFPFLKEIRFNDSNFINKNIHKDHQHLCPEGWSPVQLATYKRDIELLKMFLNLNFAFRTKKRQGGVSLEYNPLHIAIKIDFTQGAQYILNHTYKSIFNEKKGHRFIDEKTHYKQTPFALAVEESQKTQFTQLAFIKLITRVGISGYVESYFKDRLMDAYQIAEFTEHPEIQSLVRQFARAPNYNEYKEKRRKFGHRTSYPLTIQ